jgi:hypothetical protein
MSSAYRRHILQPLKGSLSNNKSLRVALHLTRKLIAMLKRKDDRRSPCRTPLRNLMFLPATELSTTFELPCKTSNCIYLTKISGRFKALKHWTRKSHSSESNALCISALKTIIILFCLVASPIIFWV